MKGRKVLPPTYLWVAICGQRVPVSPVSFGHVSQGLVAALQGQEAEGFKVPLRKLKMSTHPALMVAALATTDYPAPDHVSILPTGCRSCYKQYGM